MPIKYGVLKGTATGHLRDADDDHYQILVKAGTAMFSIAVNVHSQLNPPDLLFQQLDALPQAITKDLQALEPGFKKLQSQPGGLAFDFVRDGLLDLKKFRVVPGDVPGAKNDLKDHVEDAVARAIATEGSVIYAFGERWGPEKDRKDKYFKFLPGNGVHDIHMNQGSAGRFAATNGIFQDGCLVFEYPARAGEEYLAFFMVFQSQTFDTDAKGNPVGLPPVKPPAKKKKPSKKKPAKKKPAKKKPRKR